MSIRSKSSIGKHRSRFAAALLLIAALSMSGCCSFCPGTICAEGTRIDPDAGGEIVDRDDDKQEVRGGVCEIDPDA
ncbi:MAG: hypothetical protein OEM64_15040 [Gammaproteobacteria bacterium]|nr:hypothetical protein [Gammaproteobacteria bacterium]MDH3417622.1 hypothetical protein [Gammaproteobacteria bacterium]